MKLLHVLYSGQGGLGTYFMNFVRSDHNSSFEHFAFFYGIEPLLNEYELFCKQNGIGYSYATKGAKLDIKAYRECNDFIKINNIGLVMLHTFSMTPFYFRPFKKYLVFAVDHTNHQFKTKIEWLFTGLNHLFANKMIYFYADQFEHVRETLSFLRKGKQTHLIPKTIDTEHFRPEIIKSRSILKIGMAGRLIAGKRHDLLFDALKLLKDMGIEISLAIAGRGPKEEEYKKRVLELGLNSSISFSGNLTQSEIVPFYQSLDFYIHASDGETICYSIMEAQACGLPILASNVEGVNTTLIHRETALLFENSKESIVEQLETLIADEQLSNALSMKSRTISVDYNSKYNAPRQLFKLI